MRSKDNMRKGLYEILDWFERERSQKVREFWSCVFKDSILNQYPTLRLLRNSLMDGQSFLWSQRGSITGILSSCAYSVSFVHKSL